MVNEAKRVERMHMQERNGEMNTKGGINHLKIIANKL
jgi:hypothetical protein